MSAAPGTNGGKRRLPKTRPPIEWDDDHPEPQPLSEGTQRKWDALPATVLNATPFRKPFSRERAYLCVTALRHNGFTTDEAIEVACSAFPKGCGDLGPIETARVFRELWAERDQEEAERAIPSRLRAQLSAGTWLSRPMPTVDRLLGDFITTTTRAFLVGRTGLGKTMLGLAIAMGIGFGLGFLHWRSSRPGRVLFIDGEMPTELLIQRIRDAARRIGREDLIDNVMVFSTADAEKLGEAYPALGMFEPLNTDAGHEFIKRLCEMLKPDVVILDNVQSLFAGVQKDEETWIPVLPLVQWLTAEHIGQLWFDHAGLADRQYGSVVKSWRMDAVGFMKELPDDEQEPYETAFLLSFDPPHGKARRRTPDNWNEFSPHIIRLRDDVWTSEPAEKRNGSGVARGKVAPSRRVFHNALIDAIAHAGTRPGETTHDAWETECVRRDLIEKIESGDTRRDRERKRIPLRRAKSELQAQHWIGVDGERVMDLTHDYRH
jgi:hypothetical protein